MFLMRAWLIHPLLPANMVSLRRTSGANSLIDGSGRLRLKVSTLSLLYLCSHWLTLLVMRSFNVCQQSPILDTPSARVAA